MRWNCSTENKSIWCILKTTKILKWKVCKIDPRGCLMGRFMVPGNTVGNARLPCEGG
jgi:hypothetical protein